eukprot:TRINITY_DN7483_c1_g1_i2.p1 TRINITY_DN7483_c1_g1~~TRINITY_DN7483_c1_g1_i2.p1  ORF type:complete len:122 (+),score=20.68 TRINITY_DN7483_c1_g1_i2:1087-1452(+)
MIILCFNSRCIVQMSGSTMLNLSLLTSDMWAVFIRIFSYHEEVDWMYYVAFGAVAVGLVIYSGGEKEENETSAQITESGSLQCNKRDEEAGTHDPIEGSMVGSQRKVHGGKGPYVLISDEQ